MSIFSVVTIREASKEVANKCLQRVGDKYVFEYTVEYSLQLGELTGGQVFTAVSSDSAAVKEYCAARDIFFIDRNPELASDTARIEGVIYDAYQKTGRDFDYISLLFGNVPTRYPEEFTAAHSFLAKHKEYDAVVSMQNVGKYNPAWVFELDEAILPTKEEAGYRRQDLKQFMGPDGHTFLFRAPHFLAFMEHGFPVEYLYQAFGSKIKPWLNDKLIIDIDNKKDMKLAELLMKEWQHR